MFDTENSFLKSLNVHNNAMVHLWEDQVQILRDKIKDIAIIFGLNTVKMVIVTLQGVTQAHLTNILLIIEKKQQGCVFKFTIYFNFKISLLRTVVMMFVIHYLIYINIK